MICAICQRECSGKSKVTLMIEGKTYIDKPLCEKHARMWGMKMDRELKEADDLI